jgi:hypothetical protein
LHHRSVSGLSIKEPQVTLTGRYERSLSDVVADADIQAAFEVESEQTGLGLELLDARHSP